MLLTCRLLKDVGSVNSFAYADTVEFTIGDTLTVYFQLIDSSVDTFRQGFNPAGRRYVAADAATLSVVLDSVDDARKVTRAAVQPFPGDLSIWSVDVRAVDATKIRGTITLRLTLTEDDVVTRGVRAAALLARSA